MLVALLALLTAAEAEPLRTVGAGSPVVVARGETVLLEVTGPLRDLPETNDLEARPFASALPPGVAVLEWTEQVVVRAGKRASVVVAPIILRVDPRAPLGDSRLDVGVDVVEQAGARNVAILSMTTILRIVAQGPDVPAVERAFATRTRELERARASARLISSIAVVPDRLELPPRAVALKGPEKVALRAMLTSLVRAEAARDALRAAADVEDPKIAEAALRALARLADPPPKPGRSPPMPDAARVVGQAIGLFDRHEIEAAHRLLLRARMTPGLGAERLPQVLARLGVIEAARDAREIGTELIGQAICLDPTLSAPSARPPFKQAFDEVKRRGRCNKRLAPHSTSARATSDPTEGAGVLVRALFGPDPFHVIERGVLEIVDAGGGKVTLREVSVLRGDLASVEAFIPAAELGDFTGGLRVRARAYDGVGIEISASGVPEPTLVAVEAEVEEKLEIEWWMWAAGGAAVLFGASAIAIAASSGEPTRVIGPIDVRF